MADAKPKSTVSDILNTIRDNMDKVYQERVPASTRTNLAEVGKAITTDTITMNAFLSALINKVALSTVRNKSKFENPFAPIKGSRVPLGANIEEIYINPATDTGYQPDPNLLLKTTKPDGKACYYGMNRQGRYTVTIFEEQLARAFTNEGEFMQLINTIIMTLYSGDSIDEFILAKNTLAKGIDNNVIEVVDGDIAQPGKIMEQIADLSKDFRFPRTEYCGYNRVNNLNVDSTTEKPCITWCPMDDQIIIMPAKVETQIDFNYLANIYNMSVVEINKRKIIVDDIPAQNKDIYAIICDRAALQIRDVVDKTKEFDNGSTLEHTWFYHHWQFFYISMFANCMAIGKDRV